jgi:AGZA family xanthine/uracil permease-like MFS transporter
MRGQLERYFEFEKLGATWRAEFLGGVTTFVTMAYIVFVNPSILGEAGMPVPAVMAATCISASFASILMGAFARYPIALAPGMGINAYFTYTVVKGMGVSWQVALGAVFLSGVGFLLLTLAGLRQKIFESIPKELYSSVAVGIGLFIAFIGFRNSGIVVAHPATMVTLGDLSSSATALALFGLVITSALMAKGIRAAMLLGILITTAVGVTTGIVVWQPQPYSVAAISGTAFQLDIAGAWKLGLLEIIFVFFFVDLFDNIGTLVAVGKKAKLFQPDGSLPRVKRILLADATATIAGSLMGTSTVVSYIESNAGIVAGGRTGVTAIVTGLLFAVMIFAAPLAGVIPAAATAPALILVGAAMLAHVSEINWDDLTVAIPAFLTMTAIPLTFSIANGLAIGFTMFALLKLLTGRAREAPPAVYVLAVLFVIRFIYASKGG